MRFNVTRTSTGSHAGVVPCLGATRAVAIDEHGEEYHAGWFVEIDGLQGLISFTILNGRVIVATTESGETYLEIYDDNRE